MGARHAGRTAAMQVLYELDTSGDFEDVEGMLERHFASFEPQADAEARDFASELCQGVVEHLEELDELLENASTNWRVARMSRVDRNVLRVATFELYFCPEVPDGVAINEGVELAKHFGSSESRQFVNGVLDRLRRTREGAPKP